VYPHVSKMPTINISIASPGHRYGVHIESGLFGRLPSILYRSAARRTVWLVTDSNVLRLYGRSLQHGLTVAGMDVTVVEISPGEGSKSWKTAHALHTQMLRHGVDRKSLVIALGGGVVGDVAGFVAATLLRGIDVIQVPTTLLAQVDSSTGGKVGINHPLGKNLVGAFHHPSAVYIDPELLRTLPAREFRSGLAEVIKTAAALDRRFFAHLTRIVPRLNRTNDAALAPVITRAVRLKAAVVEHDERETDFRKVLNLGHTIGHAVEAASGFQLRHGEAVAIGLAAEARIAARMGILSLRDAGHLASVLSSAGLPTRIPRSIKAAAVLRGLSVDKKSDRGTPRFVMLRRPADCLIGVAVPTAFLAEELARR
jgi:3-dehydroquinate synthase